VSPLVALKAPGLLVKHLRHTSSRREILEHQLDIRDLLSRLVAVADEAGRIAMRYYRPGGRTAAGVEWKGDGSPVTQADLEVNAMLEREVRALRPEAAWLSEESADDTSRLTAREVFIVDPIDGTRGFSEGDPNWAVAVALVADGRPVCGVVHAPALAETYAAAAGYGATLNGRPLPLRDESEVTPDLRITCPKVLANALTGAGVDFAFQPKIASLALRVAKVASGVYDAGFTTRDSHDWDLAAADMVLTEAGGILADLSGAPVLYNRPDPVHGVLTAAPRALRAELREALGRTHYGREG
jgi:myo-inositol-1(or 4)-monophosphatase